MTDETFGDCPNCGAPVVEDWISENERVWVCQDKCGWWEG